MKTYNKYAIQAITTKFMGPTNTLGSRIKAYCDRGSIIFGYNHELIGADCHIYAANALLNKFAEEDGSNWVFGEIKDYAIGAIKDGYVFVFVGGAK